MRAAARFDCSVCGKPLGYRRARQGLTSHPACRHSLPPAEVAAALGLAEATLARLQEPLLVGDPELDRLLRLATRQAAELIGDLHQLRSYVGGGSTAASAAPVPADPGRPTEPRP